MYDMIIIGGGPAGLSAALYMARAKCKTLVIEKEKIGGQITITSEIVNYPGVYKTSGSALTKDMQKQAESFGAEFTIDEVVDMDLTSQIKTIKTTNGEYKALSVVLALGASPRKLGFEGEQEFTGRGVAYCATCDGQFFTDKIVYVIGGGFAAAEEAVFLTKYAKEVRIIVRESDFSCDKMVSDEVYNYDKIKVFFNSEVENISGENVPNKIQIKNNLTNEIKVEEITEGFGVFVFAGYIPNTKWLDNKVMLDNGYIVTDSNQLTNIDGVYAAGDVCIKKLRQVVTAVSDGAKAATTAAEYVQNLHKKLNLEPFEVERKQPIQTEEVATTSSNTDFISKEMAEELKPVFEKFENNITVKGVFNNSALATEMRSFLKELNEISSKVSIVEEESKDEDKCYLEILDANLNSSGITYYAMPGGHEFNSFILGMYNVAGPGTAINESDLEKINSIDKLDMKVLISLSCTMCPDVVVATQKIASLNSNITASAIDISKYPDMKEKYNVMSVPCMVVNDEKVHFGKKSMQDILELVNNK